MDNNNNNNNNSNNQFGCDSDGGSQQQPSSNRVYAPPPPPPVLGGAPIQQQQQRIYQPPPPPQQQRPHHFNYGPPPSNLAVPSSSSSSSSSSSMHPPPPQPGMMMMMMPPRMGPPLPSTPQQQQQQQQQMPAYPASPPPQSMPMIPPPQPQQPQRQSQPQQGFISPPHVVPPPFASVQQQHQQHQRLPPPPVAAAATATATATAGGGGGGAYPPIQNLSLNDNIAAPPSLAPPPPPSQQQLQQQGYPYPSSSYPGGIPPLPQQLQQPQQQEQQPQKYGKRSGGGGGGGGTAGKLPNPVHEKHYTELYAPLHYRTITDSSKQINPPPAAARFTVTDEGSCDPRFIRPTLHCVPRTSDMLNDSKLPFGAILQPLAEIPLFTSASTLLAAAATTTTTATTTDTDDNGNGNGDGDRDARQKQNNNNNNNKKKKHQTLYRELPVVDAGEEGPLKCTRCGAYINPFVRFVESGTKYACSLCNTINDVPHHVHASLIDGYASVNAAEERPELKYGSVEFVAPLKDQATVAAAAAAATTTTTTTTTTTIGKRQQLQVVAKPLHYIFVVDVSYPSLARAVLYNFTAAMKSVLRELAAARPDSRVGFVTVAKQIRFYRFKNDGAQPQILVLGNTDEVFAPISAEALPLLSGENTLTMLEAFLDKLDQFIDGGSSSVEHECALGSAMSAAEQVLAQYGGGKILAFASQVPNRGLGGMKPRNAAHIYGKSKDRILFSPDSQNDFWKNFSVECAKHRVCVDLFLFPHVHNAFLESSTLGQVCAATCGQLYVYSSYNARLDAERLRFDLRRNLLRETGYNAILRVRCSQGFSVKRYWGHFYEPEGRSGYGEIDLAGIDADKALVVEFKHDGKINEKQEWCFVQCALLYTTASGQRRIRVHTLRQGVAPNIGKVFRHADMDAQLGFEARWAVVQCVLNNNTLLEVRNQLTERLVQMLLAYKKHCTTSGSGGTAQLILPEALKFAPLYGLALQKSPAIRSGASVPIDEKIAAMQYLMSVPVHLVVPHIFPRLYPLHTLDEHPVILAEDDDRGGDYNNSDEEDNLEGDDLGPEVECSLPPPLALSSESIEGEGVYLMDDTMSTTIWLGKDAAPETLKSLFNISTADDIHLETQLRLFKGDNPTAKRMRMVLCELRAHRPFHGKLRVFWDRDPNEAAMFSRLVEDKDQFLPSYVDFLRHIHREIESHLSK